MDFYVVLQRPGFRIARKTHAGGRVGCQHRMNKEDSKAWFIKKYDGVIAKKKAGLAM